MSGLIICLTGGIASGKTFVSNHFSTKNVAVIDADVIAREVVEVGKPALSELVLRFGQDVLNIDGSLNRAELKRLAFQSKKSVTALNQILHPVIGSEIKRQIKSTHQSMKLLVIPLFKSFMLDAYGINRVLLVDVAASIQIKRVMDRDGVSQPLANKIISSQASRSDLLTHASDVIVNDGTINQLRLSADLVYAMYLEMAGDIIAN
ncbi:dephospho-CoA kinase [Marinicella litoralis]|uniref:Dephospho-CoA kinase n=1 Tax=Marinicella litoralis TaxID=644220 RepID=A0A4R6XRS8_9GAMM|nr:dephospho-CoA kinase [Marinicella litoralis]TDR22446.1 dephospho-CoA kinase [Marinicella litoralis]